MFGFTSTPDDNFSCFENISTLPDIPNKQIVKSFGLVQYIRKGVAGDSTKLMETIFTKLLEEAQKIGATHVVNAKLTTGSYEQQGAKWVVSYVIAYGDAVEIN